jgi:hypothetical protein
VTLLLLLTIAQLQSGALAPAECKAAPTAPTLDHVVLVVADLDQAAAQFERHGFRMKSGRLHANNLLNRHIKFRDGSSIELMTVAGAPGDGMARRYADLLAAGEGGVYVAFKVASIETPARHALALQLQTQRSASGPWQFLGFATASPAAAVFFGSGHAPVRDPDSLLAHRPAVSGLAEVWLEGGSELRDLLENLGGRRCGPATFAQRTGERIALGRGSVVIVPARSGVRPRVLGAVLRSQHGMERRIQPHPGFWIRYQRS